VFLVATVAVVAAQKVKNFSFKDISHHLGMYC